MGRRLVARKIAVWSSFLSSRPAIVPVLLGLVLASVSPTRADGGEADKVVSVGKTLGWYGKISERCNRWRPLITATAREHKLDEAFLMAIARIESGFNPEARSRVGATGLMQVMPSTGRRLECGRLTNAKANVRCAARLLRKLLDYYKGRLVYAMAGYASGLKHPSTRRREGRAPGTRYLEAVMRERSRYLRYGCEVPRRRR